ncbi:MAG: hypothetical protein V4543_11640 [Bacteroidota bacterium]
MKMRLLLLQYLFVFACLCGLLSCNEDEQAPLTVTFGNMQVNNLKLNNPLIAQARTRFKIRLSVTGMAVKQVKLTSLTLGNKTTACKLTDSTNNIIAFTDSTGNEGQIVAYNLVVYNAEKVRAETTITLIWTGTLNHDVQLDACTTGNCYTYYSSAGNGQVYSQIEAANSEAVQGSVDFIYTYVAGRDNSGGPKTARITSPDDAGNLYLLPNAEYGFPKWGSNRKQTRFVSVDAPPNPYSLTDSAIMAAYKSGPAYSRIEGLDSTHLYIYKDLQSEQYGAFRLKTMAGFPDKLSLEVKSDE